MTLNVDGLLLGVYNFTITLYDQYGNNNSHGVLVTVIDDYLPEITYLGPIIFNELNSSNTVSWLLNDYHPLNYTIYQNDILNRSGTWTDDEIVLLNIDGLSLGIYNFTILIFDESNNFNRSVILIEIVDLSKPEFTFIPSPPQYSEGTAGLSIQWNTTDKYPGNYTIYKDAIPILLGDWNNSHAIILSLDGLMWGGYNYTIVIQDIHNNTISNSIDITVTDGDIPVIIGQSNENFEFNSTSGVISWDVTDTYPATYRIFRNGSEIVSSNVWVSGFPISVSFDTIFVGMYNYTIVVLDQSGNENHDSVLIIVTRINTIQPLISIVPEVYEGHRDRVNGVWKTIGADNINGATVVAELKLGEVTKRTIQAQTDANGRFNIVLDYRDIPEGDYVWLFSFSRFGYDDQQNTIAVKLLPHIPDISITLPPEISVGSLYIITIEVTYNNTTPPILSLQDIEYTKQGPVDDVVVHLTIGIKFENGTTNNFQLDGKTDLSGFTQVSIQITEGMIEITRVRVDNFDFPSDFDFTPEDINILNTKIERMVSPENPHVIFQSSGTTNGVTSNEDTSISNLLPYLYVLFAIGLIAFLIVVIWYFRRKRKMNIEKRNQEAYDEIYGLNSIRLIVMHSLANQNPFFSEQFGLFETDSVLIAGLTSALSAFLDEIEEEKLKGFQTMERSGVSITSHKGELSILTVISSLPLQKNFHERIKNAHKEIESQFGGPISEPTISVSNFDPNKIAEIFEDSKLKFHLLRGVVLDVAKLTSILDNSSRNDNA
ncbi:MAG: hypothetical protein ACXADH_14675, partial [Candidatus Kariarchaeaceae archaeon]